VSTTVILQRPRRPHDLQRLAPGPARLAIGQAFLDERCEADVVVPGEREGEKVSLRMRDSTLANVIEAAGLTIRDSEPPATTY
jgi:hypothetical protein